MTVALFVYGTLAPDEPAWDLLAPHVAACHEASVPGCLYDTGRGYPAAVFASGTDVVRGWYCTLVDAPLAMLDTFEGDEYERVIVVCDDGTEALAYQWVAPLDGYTLVRDGRWKSSR